MCQAAPLARCSNHAKKTMADIETAMSENSNQLLGASQRLLHLKQDARKAGYTNEQIMDPNTSELEEIHKVRREHDQLTRDSRKLIRDTWEEELHMDSTPKGRKTLEEDKNAAYRGFRLKNAKAMNEWHKRLRGETDSEGHKILSKEASVSERRAFLGKEFAQAREEFNAAVANGEQATERRDKLNAELAKYDTDMVGKIAIQNRRIGMRVAKPGASKEEAEEIEYLERQKDSTFVVSNQSHHDQILARAKMNRVNKALQIERKRDAKAKKKAEEDAKAEFQTAYAERKVKAKEIVDDLKKSRITLTENSKAYTGEAGWEGLRLSAKASAVSDSTQLLEFYREMSHGNEAKAFAEFREDLTKKHARAAEEALSAESESDRAIFRGAQGGFSLVLDKIRGI